MYIKEENSIPLKSNTVKSTKGFLNEIRTQENQLVGYLFGTQHEISIDSLERLDPRILTCFDNSSHVYFELENLFSEIDNNEPPNGVEHFLYRRGVSQKKEFKGLETELSRKKIEEKLNIDEEYSYQIIKAQGLLVFVFRDILAKYELIQKSFHLGMNIDELKNIIEDLLGCLKLMDYVVKNSEFFDRRLDDKFLKIIEEISKLLAVFGVIPKNTLVLKEKFLAQREMSIKNIFGVKDRERKALIELTKNYEDGNKTIFEDNRYDKSSLFTVIYKCKKKLQLKEIQERDAVMAETVHSDLLETLATNGNRCGFYAPGACHVIGDYSNSLPKLLVQKGWVLNEVDMCLIASSQPFEKSANNLEHNRATEKKPIEKSSKLPKTLFFSKTDLETIPIDKWVCSTDVINFLFDKNYNPSTVSNVIKWVLSNNNLEKPFPNPWDLLNLLSAIFSTDRPTINQTKREKLKTECVDLLLNNREYFSRLNREDPLFKKINNIFPDNFEEILSMCHGQESKI
ncbi:MAG: hypothetical protein H0U73_04925 [Tatlockia sp.]|nr:hypothetical protein [Tatlockia sp.]